MNEAGLVQGRSVQMMAKSVPVKVVQKWNGKNGGKICTKLGWNEYVQIRDGDNTNSKQVAQCSSKWHGSGTARNAVNTRVSGPSVPIVPVIYSYIYI